MKIIRTRFFEREYHTPTADTENPVPVELEDPREEEFPRETPPVSEETVPRDEFHEEPPSESAAAEPERAGSDRRHSRVKEFFLKPVIAVTAVASVVLASYGADLLGYDFLTSDFSEWWSSSEYGRGDDSGPDGPYGSLSRSVITDYVSVTYLPTGETYRPESANEQALADAKDWILKKGGDPEAMRFLRYEERGELVYSDDAIVIGDPDSSASLYVAQGELYLKTSRTAFYEAADSLSVLFDPAREEGDDEFPPSFSNPFPDFDGDYAWGEEGSEEYVRFYGAEQSNASYLVIGEAWKKMGGSLGTVPGARYDENRNTLTLENFTGSVLDVNLMGNAFTIELIGENRLDQLQVWGAGHSGSVWIRGSGSLTVNGENAAPDGVGIRLNAEGGAARLLVDRGATLEAFGASAAILITDTLSPDAILYLKPTVLTGGVRAVGDFVHRSVAVRDENGFVTGQRPVSLTEFSRMQGVTLYDFSVTDETGAPSRHVLFEPR